LVTGFDPGVVKAIALLAPWDHVTPVGEERTVASVDDLTACTAAQQQQRSSSSSAAAAAAIQAAAA